MGNLLGESRVSPPRGKETKTHAAPSECVLGDLRRGDLVYLVWHSQDEPVWAKFLGVAALVDAAVAGTVVPRVAAVHYTFMPPVKDERNAVTLLASQYERVNVMRRKDAMPT